jgi:hypothetical protein
MIWHMHFNQGSGCTGIIGIIHIYILNGVPATMGKYTRHVF